MYLRKIVASLFMVNMFLCYQVQAADLIETIVKHEKNIAAINKDILYLWNICFRYEHVQHGFVTKKIDENTSVSVPVYSWLRELQKKPSCTDIDVKVYRDREKDLQEEINRSVEAVKTIVAQTDRSCLDQKDVQGYTAQNYCYTAAIYEELRKQGASFQILPWVYFNPVTATTSIVTIASIVAVFSCVMYQKFISKSKQKPKMAGVDVVKFDDETEDYQ